MLTNITLNIKSGSKVCLVGKPGSGVSMFMLGIMGEATLTKGHFKLNGKLSYLSMSYELILTTTVKRNIIMNERYNANKFVSVLDIVELDLTRFAAGEQTEILLNGQNISYDERKKILLARVLYHGGDIYCLDKCFESWCPDLSERIFKKMMNV